MRKLKLDELNRIDPETFKKSEKLPVSVILENIRSLSNIGSVFRTCDAFRIEHIYLAGITACPPHREIHKTALGATESVSWSYHEKTEEVISMISKKNYLIYAAEQTTGSTLLHNFTPKENKAMAIIFGNEVYGVESETINLCHGSIEIPQFGTKHSLNIAVSTGIILWDIVHKLHSNRNKNNFLT